MGALCKHPATMWLWCTSVGLKGLKRALRWRYSTYSPPVKCFLTNNLNTDRFSETNTIVGTNPKGILYYCSTTVYQGRAEFYEGILDLLGNLSEIRYYSSFAQHSVHTSLMQFILYFLCVCGFFFKTMNNEKNLPYAHIFTYVPVQNSLCKTLSM